MTVKELKEELECYDDDMNVVFEVCDDFEPDRCPRKLSRLFGIHSRRQL